MSCCYDYVVLWEGMPTDISLGIPDDIAKAFFAGLSICAEGVCGDLKKGINNNTLGIIAPKVVSMLEKPAPQVA